MLRNDDDARAVLRAHELGELTRHRGVVVGNEEPAVPGGKGEDFGILQAGETRRVFFASVSF